MSSSSAGVPIGHGLLLPPPCPGRSSRGCVRASARGANDPKARRLAVAMSQGRLKIFSGTPVAGQRSSAAKQGFLRQILGQRTSRSILAVLVISRGCSTRQTASCDRAVSLGDRHGPPRGCGETSPQGPATSLISHVPSQPAKTSLWSCMNLRRRTPRPLLCPAARGQRSRR